MQSSRTVYVGGQWGESEFLSVENACRHCFRLLACQRDENLLRLIMMRILAICTSHIGGVLLMTPAVELLARLFPQAEISVLVRKGTQAVLENNPQIKRIYTDGEITSNQRMGKGTKSSLATRLAQLPRGWGLVRELRRQHFDLVMNFSGGDRAALLTFFSGARERVGQVPKGGFVGKSRIFTRLFPRPVPPIHRVLMMTDLVTQFARSRPEFAGKDLSVGPLILKPTPENSAWAEAEWKTLDADQRPRVLMHPTSRVRYKCWAPEKWAEVISSLQKNFGAQVLVTCSPDPAEIALAERTLDLCPQRPAARLGGMTLGQLAALMERADLFLGVDSAPMHMAAAVGVPVVAIFGPSNDVDWSPWGKNNRVVRRPCPCLEKKDAACSPENGMKCLNDLTAAEVYKAAAEVLTARPARRAKSPVTLA